MDGLRLAFSWLTVLPVPGPPEVDRRVAAVALRWAPLVGLLLGGSAAAVLLGLTASSLPPLLAGLVTVAFLALVTRGMHLDGLADTADGLGCYGPPERALTVMRDGGAGPFAVITVVLMLGMQAAALGSLATAAHGWVGVAPAVLTGRIAFLWCCRRGVAAARPEGLGALVAGSQPWWSGVLGWAVAGGAAVFSVPGRPWQGPLAVLLAAGLVVALSRHTRRRFGGVSGDVLGAATELSTTVVLVVLAAGR